MSAKPKAPVARQERSEETRDKLLAAAAEVFGSQGYEGTTTRLVAKKAAVRLSAINYYFGNKEGLFRAVMEQVAARVHLPLRPLLDDINSRVTISVSEARRLLHTLVDHFAVQILANKETEFFVPMWLREQFDPTDAFEIIYLEVVARMLHPLIRLTAYSLSLEPEDPRCRLRALTLMGQVLIFRTARRAVLRTMNWPAFEQEQLQLVRSTLSSNLDALHPQV